MSFNVGRAASPQYFDAPEADAASDSCKAHTYLFCEAFIKFSQTGVSPAALHYAADDCIK
jgi:hypothetical protein